MDRMTVVQALLVLAVCSGASSVHPGQCPAIDDDVIQTNKGSCLNSCESDSSCDEGYQKCCYNGCGKECLDVRLRTSNGAQGACPLLKHDTIGVCLDECSPSDDRCEDGKMCCGNGCGHVCTTPVADEPTPEKQGKCPVLDVVREGIDTCSVVCTADSDCKSTKKCCSNGCGSVCVNPVKSKTGSCPNLDMLGDNKTGDCLANCTSDEECPGEQRCCSIGCSDICMAPIKPNPRECPETVEGNPCDENCSSDGDCTGVEICCDTGCGHVCVDPARPKPGQCPQILKNTSVGICTEDCSSDVDCTGELKCCSNGCGHVCTRPDEQPKPGNCPEILHDTMGICSEECSSDANCTRDLKCCSNGCGHVCLRPEEQPKPGNCPEIPDDTMGICTEECSSDANCTQELKCCSNGCGHVCMRPEKQPKPGNCPEIHDTMGICSEECSSDANCSGELKCCSNGCGHVCMRPGEQPKPGNCPEIPDDTMMGVCTEECSSDANCTRELKCCSNGCGHVCKEPLWYGCPDIPTDLMGICIDKCDSDIECVGNQMCCSNGCGHDCITPVLKTKPARSGQCPIVGEDTVGTCVDQCHSDEDCSDVSQKCCSTGCGHVCMDTVIEATHNSGCRLGENFYIDGEVVSTSDDCNTCICSSGEVVCRISVNCKGIGTFSVSMKAPVVCGVAGIIISLLLVAVLVKCYVMRLVSTKKPYKMIYEVQEFEPVPRHVL
ncbi:uncharacterized protein [Asterias amurensis]|uniref:uncharacterized protein n=1 Tax=Asterias amurensis TaxID=7602 RepID=UPI003AB151CB